MDSKSGLLSPSTATIDVVLNPDETSPLLIPSTDGVAPAHNDNGELRSNSPSITAHEDGEHSSPTAYGQIFLLCFTALVEPIAFFALFPFVNEMIHLVGHTAEQDIGFYAGLIESLFSLVQMGVMIFYGRLADRIGRKPVLVFTLAGLGAAEAMFGMAQNLGQMVVLRSLAGLFGGCVVTTRVMVMENCGQEKERQGRVFGWYMFSRHMGMLLGPLIGGPLANPSQQFPKLFGNVPFWEKHPYALSTYVAGGVIFSAAVLSLFFLEETLHRKTDTSLGIKPTLTTSELLSSPGVRMVLYLHFHVIVLSLAFTAMSTVMMYTSIELGGYGFSDQEIALFLAVSGGAQAVWVLVVFPYLHARYSTASVLKLCGILWPAFTMTFPILNEVLRKRRVRLFWNIAPCTWAFGNSIAISLACVQLYINSVSPSAQSFGALNALALTISSGNRAFVPALSTSVFAAGIRSSIVDGHLAFVCLTVWALLLNVVCCWLPAPAAADGGTAVKTKALDAEGTSSGQR